MPDLIANPGWPGRLNFWRKQQSLFHCDVRYFVLWRQNLTGICVISSNGGQIVIRCINGLMDSDFFLTWLRETFLPHIKARKVSLPVVLFVDGHSTHISLEANEFSRRENLVMYCLQQHASHIMQPLDLCLFSSLEYNWRKSVTCRIFHLPIFLNSVLLSYGGYTVWTAVYCVFTWFNTEWNETTSDITSTKVKTCLYDIVLLIQFQNTSLYQWCGFVTW